MAFKKINKNILVVFLLILIACVALLYLFGDFYEDLFSPSGLKEQQKIIVYQLRLPRMMMAMANGILLSVAGVVTQALFKNPLAAPSLIGVSSGASLAAACSILATSGATIPIISELSLPFAAFIGGTITCFIVFKLSWI